MNKKLLISMILFSILLAGLVFAFTPPCRCIEFCEETQYCYMGECTNLQLADLDCMNGGDYADKCPICPICNPLAECIDNDNKFIYDDDPDHDYCKKYYDEYLETYSGGTYPNECIQTVNFTVREKLPNGKSTSLKGASISLINLIDGIDYSDVFEFKYNYTNYNGSFTVPRCRGDILTTFVASKEGYDAHVIDKTLYNDYKPGPITIDFELPSGVCHVDCTNSYGRCNPQCEGFEDEQGENCSFYVDINFSKNVTELCAYKKEGTNIILNETDDTYYMIDCCEGSGELQEIVRPSIDINLVEGKDLISIQKPVMFSDSQPGRISIFTWNN